MIIVIEMAARHFVLLETREFNAFEKTKTIWRGR